MERLSRERTSRLNADVVVVGTGVAGLACALELAGCRVHLLTKTRLASGSSPWAQGGVAVALGAGDSPELHAADTVAAGAGLVEPEVARLLARDGVTAVRRLIELGAEFDRTAEGKLAFGREAAHGRRRILHAHGDSTGAELVRALAARATAAPWIEIFEGAFGVELVTDRAGERVRGLRVRHADGRTVLHEAPRVVLATGGIGQLYRYTTNPPESTGDGLALAAAAGTRLVDLEFVQFHPTALAIDRDPLPLLTEALRGEGAILVDESGRRFLAEEHEDAELAPRDLVARAIWKKLAASGGKVFLDARKAVGEKFPSRFPTAFEQCRAAGIDPRIEPMPVVPAAHYFMGGVAVDEWGATSLPGLWACGEVAATGVHGANRLASNSLLEALVFGARVAESIEGTAIPLSGRPERGAVRSSTSDPRLAAPGIRRVLRDLAWERVGLVRDGKGLAFAEERFAALFRELPDGPSETRNLAIVGALVAAAARRREESRGAHFRSDFPESVEALRHRQFLTAAVGRDGVDCRFEPLRSNEAGRAIA